MVTYGDGGHAFFGERQAASRRRHNGDNRSFWLFDGRARSHIAYVVEGSVWSLPLADVSNQTTVRIDL